MAGRMTAFLAKLRAKLAGTQRRDEEYATMTSEEREQHDAGRSGGAAGEADVDVEHEFDRIEDAAEGRPPGL